MTAAYWNAIILRQLYGLDLWPVPIQN
jgi:hypothetical protein